MALGAIQALEEARLRPGEDIIVISVDGIRGAFEAMVAGKLNVTVEQSADRAATHGGRERRASRIDACRIKLVVQEFVFPKELAAETLPARKY